MSSQGCGYYWFANHRSTDWHAKEIIRDSRQKSAKDYKRSDVMGKFIRLVSLRNGDSRNIGPSIEHIGVRLHVHSPRLRRTRSIDSSLVPPAGLYSGHPVPHDAITKFGLTCPRFWREDEPRCMVTSHGLSRRWMSVKYNSPVWEGRRAASVVKHGRA
ncbi:hypothetical protein FOL47_005752 [Perkinsus chesapeaki]|uniref:Uncharacterized protein n=1 Tax=Perkinsus chesapeaki TaxID=330153 RepID=A0A7J6LVV5_PERCH|nr:hypothetical protein FOL47_005752 [Perkinsus chesapeaki]